MSETKTQKFDSRSPAFLEMEQKLGKDGLELLEHQLQLLHAISERPPNSPLRRSLAAGNQHLPKGSLVHGMGRSFAFNTDALRGVAEQGIISGELIGVVEDSETHACADFFRATADMSVSEYMEYASQPPSLGRIKTRRGERLLKRGVAFIVDPEADGMSELLMMDGYTNPDMQAFVRPISSRSSENTAAILGGVPANAIAGILVDQKIIEDVDSIQQLRQIFPEIPILDHDGELQ